MSKDVVVVTVHGMGDTKTNYDQALKVEIRDRLGSNKWSKVCWETAYYQDVLQGNQRRMMQDMKSKADIDFIKLRKFLLYGFSDAAAMEAKPTQKNSVYHQIQDKIVDALQNALSRVDDEKTPVVLLAHSLGCQVMSNYIWDAQQSSVAAGVFRSDIPNPIGKTTDHDKFLRLKTLKHLFTSGCNIPIFIAGKPKEKIEPILVNKRGWNIDWQNYYDADDVLGWPLKPINTPYREAVRIDKEINAGGNFVDWLKSSTPLAHGNYWGDDDYLDPVEDAIRKII